MKVILYPLSLIYGLIIICRNYLYAIKLFKSVKFQIPVLSVGNITVGGTGKTPHTEYLIKLLKNDFNVAFLSRGYKRNTHGFILATAHSSAKIIGDEPCQVKRKFPDLTVAVDSDRVNGIKMLIEKIPETEIIVLDDAFQHRRVSPDINILLVDYNKPIYRDNLLPYGLLREPASQKKRADIIIVTKIPENITEKDKRLFTNNMEIHSNQTIYFTYINYGQPLPVFDNIIKERYINFADNNLSVLLVSGIANPKPMITKLSEIYKTVLPVTYPDHYSYSQDDINNIIRKYNLLQGTSKVIVTTEKDAARLLPFNFKENIPEDWYYIPIEVKFSTNEAILFNNQIINHVHKN